MTSKEMLLMVKFLNLQCAHMQKWFIVVHAHNIEGYIIHAHTIERYIIHAHTHTHTYTCTHTHACMCTHAPTHTHMHTHTQEELLLACDEVRAAGEVMHQAASEFARDTFQSEKRDEMTKASRELLMSVTRLMVIADAVDVKKLLKVSSRVRSRNKQQPIMVAMVPTFLSQSL